MKHWVFVQNNFLEAAEASLSISDLSINRGYGVFDFVRTHNSIPVFINDHLDRFYASADAMHLQVPYSRAKLLEIIQSLQEKNNLPSSGIRITLTGGESADGYSLEKPTLFITQQPLELPSEEKFHTGLKMITYQHQRQLPYIKTIDYLMAIWLQPLLKQKKLDDVLYHQNSIITECPRSNFFLINYDNSILTPADDILPGITRKNLLKLSNEFNIKEKKITIAEIKKAKSAFISSTSKIVLPVHQVDEVIFQEHDLIKDIKEAFCSIYSISA